MSKQKDNVDGRCEALYIRMSPQEKADLYELARANGSTVSDFVRWMFREYYEISHRKAS